MLALTYNNEKILKLELSIRTLKSLLIEYYYDFFKVPLICKGGLIKSEKTYQHNIESYVSTHQKLLLSAQNEYSVKRNIINFFTSIDIERNYEPFRIRNNEWGEFAFRYIRYFLATKDYVSLENILFCPNPESRLIAASALIYAEHKFGYKSNEYIGERIRSITSQQNLIEVGQAMHSGAPTMTYDLPKNFEFYLQNSNP